MECRKKRRKQILTGHRVDNKTRQKMSKSARANGVSENLKKGTAAAMNSPKGGRFETNSSAKDWTIMSPEGKVYNVVNLKNWIRQNANLFGDNLTDDDIDRIGNGFRVAKNNIKKGKGTVTYKGWSILYCGCKNCEREKNTE